MTSAYQYAESGGRSPLYLQMSFLAKSYGVPSFMGRTLYAHEVYRMNMAQQVYDAYLSRKASENWADWATKNEDAAHLLARVERLLNE